MNLAVEVHEGIAGTGVVGVLRSGSSQRMVGLRADMDALPILEQGERAYISRHAGVHHGCGYDGHTAMLLGAARHLARTRDFDGQVAFIFQPAEERRVAAARARWCSTGCSSASPARRCSRCTTGPTCPWAWPPPAARTRAQGERRAAAPSFLRLQ